MAVARLFLLLGFLSICLQVRAEAVGSAFTYQGELQQSGVPVDGTFDFQFDLFNVETSGSPVATPVLVDDVLIMEGKFTVELDFGSAAFGNEKLWLQISVRDGASDGGYTLMLPRQVISPTPFAVQAQSVPDDSITVTQIDVSSVQTRVTGVCTSQNAVRVINQDGSVVCEPTSDPGCSLGDCNDAFDTAVLTCGETTTLVSCVIPGKLWTSHPAAPNDSSWESVAYGNGMFVAVSTGPTGIMSSPDGFNWTARGSEPPSNEWQDVSFGGGLFVVVSYSAAGPQIITSPDGINWTPRTAAVSAAWRSAVYGDGLWVAVASNGVNGRVMTSPDGINWTVRDAAEDTTWISVTHGNGLFVAVAGSGTHQVMTSPDGINWTVRNQPADGTWSSVAFGDGLFVAVRSALGDRIMTSPDGITWTLRAAPEDNMWQSVTYGNGLFVAVAASGGNRVMTSPDGINWTARVAAEQNSWRGVTHGDGLFVAVSSTSFGNDAVMTSQ